jgi:hypothetical protein
VCSLGFGRFGPWALAHIRIHALYDWIMAMGYQLHHMKIVITSSGFLTNNQIIRNLVFAIYWVSLCIIIMVKLGTYNSTQFYNIYIYIEL